MSRNKHDSVEDELYVQSRPSRIQFYLQNSLTLYSSYDASNFYHTHSLRSVINCLNVATWLVFETSLLSLILCFEHSYTLVLHW